jgi:hypothetical protein
MPIAIRIYILVVHRLVHPTVSFNSPNILSHYLAALIETHSLLLIDSALQCDVTNVVSCRSVLRFICAVGLHVFNVLFDVYFLFFAEHDMPQLCK